MRIGTRWSAGAPPHPSVPIDLHATIRRVDADGSSLSWTLTWLEGRPVCRRSDDVVVTLSSTHEVTLTYPPSDERQTHGFDDSDIDDDDWLLE